ncbi:MAG: hypothetical protein GEU75_11340 [Dehalococcoidia bacterium]|nr:hypothetical protein [Dehalococcoidia bacterium]
MTIVFLATVALVIGLGSAVQVGLVASLGRERGPVEAAWINVLGTFSGMALVFGIQSLRGNPPNLPSPFDNPLVFVAIALASVFALATSMRGLEVYLGIAGAFGFMYLVGAGYLAPRLGVALFASAVTAGTLIGSVVLDHYGFLGTDVHRVNVLRIFGLMFLVLGVVLVRGNR